MAESRPNGFERFCGWLFISARGQFVFLLGCVGLVALCVWLDGLTREYGRESVLAPTHDDLWTGIEFGSALGLVFVISAVGHSLLCRLLAPCGVVKNWEPTGWRLWALYVSIGCHHILTIVLVFTLLWWCTTSDFSIFPPYLAMSATQLLASLLWRAVFGTASQDEVAEPVPTEK